MGKRKRFGRLEKAHRFNCYIAVCSNVLSAVNWSLLDCNVFLFGCVCFWLYCRVAMFALLLDTVKVETCECIG